MLVLATIILCFTTCIDFVKKNIQSEPPENVNTTTYQMQQLLLRGKKKIDGIVAEELDPPFPESREKQD